MLGLKCCVLIDDTFGASKIFVFFAINFIIKYLYFISICKVFVHCITM